MKRYLVFPFIAFLMLPQTTQAQQSNLVRGVYLFGMNSVNFQTLKDSLHLNTVQTSTGWDSSVDTIQLNNTALIKIYNQRALLSELTKAQQMIFEAEQDPAVDRNYFIDRIGANVGVARRANIVDHSAGYLANTPVPNDEYRYGKNNYLATFRLSVEGTYNANTVVAACTLYCKNLNVALGTLMLYGANFPSALTYYDFVIPFSLDDTVQYPPFPPKVLTNGVYQAYPVSSCANIDLRVYWFDNVTTNLDQVVIRDSMAINLFSGTLNDSIKKDAGKFTAS